MTNEFPSEPASEPTGDAASDPVQAAQASQTASFPADALVAVQAGLIFVTTGQMACYELSADLDQVALTPAVAWRIASALRDALQHSSIEERKISVGVWDASEKVAMPHGRIQLNDRLIQIGIEPLGAGARVTVGWDYVPGLIVSLENACQWAQAGQ